MSQCELCGAKDSLSKYAVAPKDATIAVCGTCRVQLEDPSKIDSKHWQCLSSAMWSENPVVQVMAYRMLTFFKKETWATELLEQMYLDEENVGWALAAIPKASAAESDDREPTFDSNGARLLDGDSVTLIKDLDVKGGGFTAKRGTLVKGISLSSSNPEHVEGRVNGVHIVLVAKFLKKA